MSNKIKLTGRFSGTHDEFGVKITVPDSRLFVNTACNHGKTKISAAKADDLAPALVVQFFGHGSIIPKSAIETAIKRIGSITGIAKKDLTQARQKVFAQVMVEEGILTHERQVAPGLRGLIRPLLLNIK